MLLNMPTIKTYGVIREGDEYKPKEKDLRKSVLCEEENESKIGNSQQQSKDNQIDKQKITNQKDIDSWDPTKSVIFQPNFVVFEQKSDLPTVVNPNKVTPLNPLGISTDDNVNILYNNANKLNMKKNRKKTKENLYSKKNRQPYNNVHNNLKNISNQKYKDKLTEFF